MGLLLLFLFLFLFVVVVVVVAIAVRKMESDAPMLEIGEQRTPPHQEK